ncbi:MAG: hypothetical protein OXQ89_22535 [Rhodospirillaceae bacterium]|nr:hypothetical protein [Rhodospirillaceae bacterium]
MSKRITNLMARLASQISRGEPVLFLGAGFSLRAKTQSGKNVPDSHRLTRDLCQIAFPNDEFDPNVTLGDAYYCALSRARKRLQNYIADQFTISSESLPQFYETWYSMPWHKCYTLNIDDLEMAVPRRFSLPRPIKSISATTGAMGDQRYISNSLRVIHLNGMVGDSVDALTFSDRNYGERLAGPDPWLARATTDMLSRPVVYVGTELHEPTLWRYLEYRQAKGGRGVRELRPGSYLVTPALSKAREILLKSLNVDWISMTAQEFAESWLSELGTQARAGLQVIDSSRRERSRSNRPTLVAELSAEGPQDQRTDYLLGQQPSWSDLQSGRAILRDCDKTLYGVAKNALNNSDSCPPVIVCGTAGSGKSTSLMRLGLRLSADGMPVYWLDESSDINPHILRNVVLEADGPVAVLIDDGDLWGRTLTSWAIELPKASHDILFCVALRSSRIDGLLDSHSLRGTQPIEIVMPPLSDEDIVGLINALDQDNRLGVLKGKSHSQRVSAFRQQAGRQLLVGMIQATSGRRFTQKVYEEFSELEPTQRMLYGIVCVVSAQRYTIDRNELILASGSSDNETLNSIETLCQRQLIVRRTVHSQYASRHRVISEELTRNIEFRQYIGPILEGIVFSFANTVDPNLSKSNRSWRRLIRFMNHDYLIGLLSVDDARATYERIEPLLNWDYHYWLQRGALEVEVGDLSLATNFLDQAKSLANGNTFVENEYAYLQMKTAAMNPTASDAEATFNDGYTRLEKLITNIGKHSPHPYHVLGSQVLSWIRRAQLSSSHKSRLLASTIGYVDKGIDYHPNSNDLRTLLKALRKEWLMMAVGGPTK